MSKFLLFSEYVNTTLLTLKTCYLFRPSRDHPEGTPMHFVSRLNKKHVSGHKYQIKDCTLRGICRNFNICHSVYVFPHILSLHVLLIHSFNVCTENLWSVFSELLGICIYYDSTYVFTDTLSMYILIHCVFTEALCACIY
jgi:hypothetical protein